MEELVKMKRSYHWSYNGVPNQIHKTFNRGMGSLALFELIPEEKVLLVNKVLANKKDYENAKFCLPEYTIENVELGYPDWYFKSSLKSCRKK